MRDNNNVEIFKRNGRVFLDILGVGGVEISNMDFINKELQQIIDKMEDGDDIMISDGKIRIFKVA